MSMAFLTGGAPGPLEILLILFVVLLLFGSKKLPELSRSLGKSLSEFKRGKDEGARIFAETKNSSEIEKTGKTEAKTIPEQKDESVQTKV